MVVADDDGAGPVLEGVRVDLAGVDDGAVHETDRYDPRSDDLVGSVEGAADEAFLFAVGPVGHEGPDVARRGDAPVPETVESATEFEGGCHGRGLGPSDARHPGEELGVRRAWQPVEEGEDLVGHGEDALAAHARAEEGRKEVAVGEGGRAFAGQALARVGAGAAGAPDVVEGIRASHGASIHATRCPGLRA